MERKDTEGSKGGLSKHVRPDKRDPNTKAGRNPQVEGAAGNRNAARAGDRAKGD